MKEVSAQDMRKVYEAMQTPCKHGPVLWEQGVNIDCASVFYHGGEWRMVYARQDPRVPAEDQGYETWMARSQDLLHWEPMGPLLRQRRQGWDGMQADGGLLLIDPAWGGGGKPATHNGKYWMSYIGGALPGYEPDPLHMGMAFSPQIDTAAEWERLPQPILRMDDADVRPFEVKTLYKSTVIHDEEARLGAPYVMYYNAKRPPVGVEEIGIATSADMVHWKRRGAGSVIQSGIATTQWSIAGDPQMVRYGDLWVMHYFVAYTKDGGGYAMDTFAASYDLLHWTRWDGPPLIEPSIPEDERFAHKPWVLCHNGVVYHFYCAVGSRGRCLALATSRALRG